MFKNSLLSEGDPKDVVFSLVYVLFRFVLLCFFSANLAKEGLRETEAFDMILYLI